MIAALAAAASVACAGPEHRAFDFWLGTWDVVETTSGKPAGHSIIEAVFGGCAVRETWTEPGFSGGSLNAWDRSTGRWRQTWTDSAGAWREFVGDPEGGRMVLVWRHPAPAGGEEQVRMAFTPNADGTVRQYSDRSTDGGRTWTLRYDYTYRRAKN